MGVPRAIRIAKEEGEDRIRYFMDALSAAYSRHSSFWN